MKNLAALAVCFLVLSGLASSQAAVEGALTHGLSGAASATAGKALGQIGNQLAGRLGQQTSSAVGPRVTTVRPGTQKVVKVPQTATTAAPASNGGSLIASIQGGEAEEKKPCTPKTADKAQKQTECGIASPSTEQAPHPSEITLPAAKE